MSAQPSTQLEGTLTDRWSKLRNAANEGQEEQTHRDAPPMGITGPVQRGAVRCSAHKRNGDPCGQPARRGTNVCRSHGGNAPQTLAKAKREIEGPILEAAVKRHRKLIEEGKNEAAVGAMIRDTYNRVGIGTEETTDEEVRELLIRVTERHPTRDEGRDGV